MIVLEPGLPRALNRQGLQVSPGCLNKTVTMWDVMRGIARPLQEYFIIGCFSAKNSCHTLPEKDGYNC